MASMSSAQIVSASAIHNKAMATGLAGIPPPPTAMGPTYPPYGSQVGLLLLLAVCSRPLLVANTAGSRLRLAAAGFTPRTNLFISYPGALAAFLGIIFILHNLESCNCCDLRQSPVLGLSCFGCGCSVSCKALFVFNKLGS